MSQATDKLARRIDPLTADGRDKVIKLLLIIIDGVMYVKVENGRLERLGKR